MIAGIRSDKAAGLLEPPRTETEDDKQINRLWVKIFIVFGIFILISTGIVITAFILDKRFLSPGVLMLAFSIVMGIYVIAKFINSKVVVAKRFKAAVEKYGRSNLIAQLSDSAAFGFFIHEDYYKNLLILTMDYVIGANEFVHALSEIREMVISKVDINEENVKKMHDERGKDVLRCVYAMELTLADGKRQREMFAIATSDMNQFFAYVHQRAPQISIRYK